MNNVYIGARYVPIFDGDWDNTKTYEPLTIVNYNNGSYTSKRTVPAGTVPTDTDYWALTGNFNGYIQNLQDQIDALNGDIEDLDDIISIPITDKFENKTICIIGDSISDTTTYPPNWTVAIKDKLLTLGASSVVNESVTGSSLVGWGTNPSSIPTGYDIYIFALGVNDWQGQFKAADIYNAIYAIAQRINLTSCECYYISPIKCYLSGARTTPISVYRTLMERVFTSIGATVISGYNMPKLNGYDYSTYLNGGIHPYSIFKDIYANYVLNAMIAGALSVFTKQYV